MELAQAFDPDQLLTQEDAARFLAVQPDTLAQWRTRGEGPAFCKLGRSVRYRRRTLIAFYEERVCSNTVEARKHKRA